jgi:hypothetical protein
MQKVVGSSPIIRSKKGPLCGPFVFRGVNGGGCRSAARSALSDVWYEPGVGGGGLGLAEAHRT